MTKKLTPLQAIRQHCKECCGDDKPKKCASIQCNLYQYRLGKNPYLKQRQLSEKQKAHLFKKKN
jgi:hypothetical protein